MQHFTGRDGWRIEFTELERTYTHLDPGPVKGEIVLEHNSLGAFTGGTLTVEGYLDWVPYSSGVRVYSGPLADEDRTLALGVLGKPESTISESGQRTTTLPLLSYSDVLDGGFIAVPEPYYEGLNLMGLDREQPERGAYGVADARLEWNFGETREAYYRRLLGDNPLGAWGLRPDTRFMIGVPDQVPEQFRLLLDTRRPACVALPSNYETGDYLSAYIVRAAERWQAQIVTRPDVGPYVPQRVQAVTTDAVLGDVEKVWTETTPVELPVTDYRRLPGRGDGTDGVWGAFSLGALLNQAVNDLDQKDVIREVVAVTAEVAVDVETALSSTPPPDWRPITDFALDYWTQIEMRDALPSLFPVGRERTLAEQSEFNDTRQFWFGLAQSADLNATVIDGIGYFTRRRADDQRRAMWEAQFAGDVIRLSYAEWLSTSGTLEPAVITVPSVQDVVLAGSQFLTDYMPRSKGLTPLGRESIAGLTELEALTWYENIGRLAYADVPDSSVTKVVLTPNAQGTLLELGARTDTGMDPRDRRSFRWRFSLPESLLKRSNKDPARLAAFWAFAVTAYSRVPGIKPVVSSSKLTIFSREVVKPLDEVKEVPGIARSPVSPQTWQGHVENELFYGPALLTLPDASQQFAANTRMVIGLSQQRTEFQTGARQR